MNESEVLDLIYQAIDVVNELRADDEKLPKDPDLVIAGENGTLSSLETATLILAVESRVNTHFDTQLQLLDDVDLVDGFDKVSSPRLIVNLVRDRLK